MDDGGYYGSFLMDPFWFVPDLFEQSEINERCTFQNKVGQGGQDEFDLVCDWNDDSEDVFKGEVYEYVEEVCRSQGGLMHLAYSLKTNYTYDAIQENGDQVETIESSTHYNVPLCLDRSCNAEDFLDHELPCSQYWTFANITGRETILIENESCSHDSNVVSSFRNHNCLTQFTFVVDQEASCFFDSEGRTKICDFSEFTETNGTDICDEGENILKYSYSIFGSFPGSRDDVFNNTHYFLNRPTCLKEGCDVYRYYLENILPFQFHDYAKSEENATLMSYTSMGLQALTDSEDEFHCSFPQERRKKKKKGGKKGKNGKKKKEKSKKKNTKKKGKKKNKKNQNDDQYYNYY